MLDALTDLDHRISRLTGGKLDLKLLVPVGLGLLAMRQVALNGFGLAQVPGYVLALVHVRHVLQATPTEGGGRQFRRRPKESWATVRGTGSDV